MIRRQNRMYNDVNSLMKSGMPALVVHATLDGCLAVHGSQHLQGIFKRHKHEIFTEGWLDKMSVEVNQLMLPQAPDNISKVNFQRAKTIVIALVCQKRCLGKGTSSSILAKRYSLDKVWCTERS